MCRRSNYNNQNLQGSATKENFVVGNFATDFASQKAWTISKSSRPAASALLFKLRKGGTSCLQFDSCFPSTVTMMRTRSSLRLATIVVFLLHTWLSLQPYGTAFCAGASNIARKDVFRRHSMDVDPLAYDRPKILRTFPQVRNLYEKVTFSWARDLMMAGNAKPLNVQDLWLLQEDRRMRNTSEAFDSLFQEELQKLPAGCATSGKGSDGNLLTGYWQSPVTRATIKM
jgi:hypothetical protein